MSVMAGITVVGLVWWMCATQPGSSTQRTARTSRHDLGALGECVTDGLDHLAGVIEDVSKIVQIVSHTVDTGLQQIA
jgi:hypothetical protein